MGHTDLTAFGDSSDALGTSALTNVFSGEKTLGTAAGWESITLSTPFDYDSAHNLVVVVTSSRSSDNSSLKYSYFGDYSSTNGRVLTRQNDSNATYADYASSANFSKGSSVPSIQFAIDVCSHDNKTFTRTVAPTCTEGGYDIYHCSDCDKDVRLNPTEALGHLWSDTGVRCDKDGTDNPNGKYLKYSCTREGCDATKIEAADPSMWDGTSSATWTNGEGTEANPYRISTAANLAFLASSVNAGETYSGQHFELTSDLDLAGETWTPIGTSSTAFAGNFDGAGHTLSGLSIASGSYQALFAYVENATIENFVVEGVSASEPAVVGSSTLSAVVATAKGATTIQNIGNKAGIRASGGSVGGILASASSGSQVRVISCYNKAPIVASGDNSGGIVGASQSDTVVQSCYNLGALTNSGQNNMGGIVGKAAAVKNCFTGGSVNLTSNYAGPIYGNSSDVAISVADACYYLDSGYTGSKTPTNCYAISADQLAGKEWLTEPETVAGKTLLAALNTGDYAGNWLSGSAIDQASPMLAFEYVKGTPTITKQPTGAEYEAADTVANLEIGAELPSEAKETGSLSYQWYKNSTGVIDPVADESGKLGTDASQAPGLEAGDEAYYYCVVTDTWSGSAVSATSDIVFIRRHSDKVAAKPTITSNPAATTSIDQASAASLEFNLSVTASCESTETTGFGSLSYQWYSNTDDDTEGGTAIAGATNATLTQQATTLGTTYYYCVVTNTFEGTKTASTVSSIGAVTVTGIEISTPAQLKQISDNVNNGTNTYTGATVTLTKSIDLQTDDDTKAWTPIGTSSNAFEGTFDGGKSTISGLSIASGSNQALFAYVKDATIENLIVDGVSSTDAAVAGTNKLAGVVATAAGTTVIRNVGNKAKVNGTSGSSGGVLAYADSGSHVTITSCYNKVDVAGAGDNIGGIVGYSQDATIVESCYNLGAVSNTGSNNTGGISGRSAVVRNCVNGGSINVTSNWAGPICGNNSSVSQVAGDTCYYLDAGYSGTKEFANCIPVTAQQLYGLALYPTDDESLRLLVASLNAGDYSGAWADGRIIKQDSPILDWEKPEGTPEITVQPESAEYASTSDSRVALSVAATPDEATYQWHITPDGIANPADAETNPPVDGATAPTLSMQDQITSAGTYYYYCVVSNNGIDVISDVAKVMVRSGKQAATPELAVPTPATQDANLTLGADKDITTTVTATATDEYGVGSLTYQWYTYDGADKEKATAVEGASGTVENGSTVTLPKDDIDTNTSGTKYYFCRTTNTFEGDLTATADSADATVVVGETIEVSTAQQLLAVADNVNTGKQLYAGLTIELIDDIDLQDLATGSEDYVWIPIGIHKTWSNYEDFKGTLEGNGHVIDGLHVTKYGDAALFGNVNGATFRNFVVKGKGIEGGGTNASGVVGTVQGGTVTISNVGNEASVSAGANIGGIVGNAWSGMLTIQNCYNKADITGSTYNGKFAGIVGNANSSATITSCYNTGNVSGTGSTANSTEIGGISASGGKVVNCVNTGTISTIAAEPTKIGAITGASYQPIDNSADACYYKEGSCAYAAQGASQDNIIPVDDETLGGTAFVATLNSGAYAGRWAEGARIAPAQASPILTWEVTEGQPYNVIITGDEGVLLSQEGTLSATASLPPAGEAGSEGTLSYQWYAGGTDDADAIEGANAATLTVTSTAAGEIDYYCKVANSYVGEKGAAAVSRFSDPFTVHFIDTEPAIPATATVTASPANGHVQQVATITLTGGATFATGAEGVEEPANLKYQWYAYDADSNDYVAIEGATDETFKPSTDELGSFDYKVGVTNVYYGLESAEVKSDAFTVTVDSIQVTSMQDLALIAANVAAGKSYKGITVTLANDIDASAYDTFAGIGSISDRKPFEGTFDGNGKKISNLKMADGLFGYANSEAVVKNLEVENAAVTAKDYYVGIVASRFDGSMAGVVTSGTLSSNISMSGRSGACGIGGLVGELGGTASIADCSSTATIKAMQEGNTDPNVGGIVGKAGYNTTIARCTFNGAIYGTGNGEAGGTACASVIGGIAGTVDSTTISDCVVVASIEGNQYVGGIVGRQGSAGSAVERCEYHGDLKGSTYVGGIVGYLGGTANASSDYTVSECLATGTVSASDTDGSAGGIVGTAEYKNVILKVCIALQQTVSGSSEFTGRVAGHLKEYGWNDARIAPEPANCYAWAGMKVNGSAVASDAETATATGKDGASVTSAALLDGETAAAPYSAWDDGWSVVAGAKPTLEANEDSPKDYPAYIKVELTDDLISPADGLVFKNEAFEDLVVVGVNGNNFEEGNDKDYTVTFQDKDGNAIEKSAIKNAGTYKAVVTPTGTGILTGSPVTKEFTIEQADLTNAEFAVIGNNGELDQAAGVQKPTPAVTLGELNPASPGDFAYSYTDENGQAIEPQNEGTYQVVITAVEGGNYKGTASTTFKITSKKIRLAADDVTGTYDGTTAFSISVSATYDGSPYSGATVKYATSQDGEYTTNNPTYTNAGTYTVWYKAEDATYAVEAPASATITISKAQVAVPAATAGLMYNGSEQTGVAGATGYTVTDGAKTDAGDYTAVATLTDKDNYEWVITEGDNTSDDQQIEWSIAKKNSGLSATADPYNDAYDGEAHGITVTPTADDSSTTSVVKYSATQDGEYTTTPITFTNYTGGAKTVYYQVENANYETFSGSSTVTITKADNPVAVDPATLTLTYGDAAMTSTVTGAQGAVSVTSSAPGVAKAQVADGVVTVTPVGAGASTLTVTALGGDNYQQGSATINVTVNKATGMTAVAYDFKGVYDGQPHGITVTATAPDGSNPTVKYSEQQDGTYDANPVTITDAGAKTVWLIAESPNYETTDPVSATITIDKAANPMLLSATTVSIKADAASAVNYPIAISDEQGALSLVDDNSAKASTVALAGNTATITVPAGTSAESFSFKVKAAGSGNYEEGETTVSVNVIAADASFGNLTDEDTGTVADISQVSAATLSDAATLSLEVDAVESAKTTKGAEAKQAMAGDATVDPESVKIYEVSLQKTTAAQPVPQEITSGFGTLKLRFNVGAKYNGHKANVTRIHTDSGTGAETTQGYTAIVSGGYVEIAVTELSEFVVAVQADPETYTVRFNSNGGSNVASQTVAHGAKASKPANPTRANYTFGGWYTNAALTAAYNFDTPVTANVTLYAKWTSNGKTMWRLYNKYSGEHLYTSDSGERASLIAGGWNDEGKGWTAPSKSGTPVYRLYNPYHPLGDHHYTTDKSEYDHLCSVGWSGEGVGWYSDDAKGVPLYRQYNPYAYGMGQSGAHNYTTSADERDNLVRLGWHDEKIAWYGVK